MAGGTFANEEDLKKYLKRRMGEGVVQVEILPEALDDAIKDTKRWFIANWGIIRTRPLQLQSGISEYTLPPDVAEVREVNVEQVRIPPLVFDREFPFYYPFPMRAEGGIVFSYPAGLYSALVQQLQWIEQLRRIFSADVEYQYTDSTRLLRLYPIPVDDRLCLVEYIANEVNMTDLFGFAEDIFVKWAMAEVKERVGRPRSKFNTLPTAGSDRTLDGDKLLQEAKDDKEKIQKETMERGYPIPFLVD